MSITSINQILEDAKQIDPESKGAMSRLEALIQDFNELSSSYPELEKVEELIWGKDGSISGYLDSTGIRKLNKIKKQLAQLSEKNSPANDKPKKNSPFFHVKFPSITSIVSVVAGCFIFYTIGYHNGENTIKYKHDRNIDLLKTYQDSLNHAQNLNTGLESKIKSLSSTIDSLKRQLSQTSSTLLETKDMYEQASDSLNKGLKRRKR